MGLRLDEWKERYENKEIVNIKNEFTINELALLQKLGVELIDKIYTEREFEILDMKVISYYYEDTMSNDEKAECIPLPEGVSREEYNNLIDKIHAINFINKKIGLESLPEDLQEVAVLRLANPQESMEELLSLSTLQLTKSGLNHRFRRILKIAELLKDK